MKIRGVPPGIPIGVGSFRLQTAVDAWDAAKHASSPTFPHDAGPVVLMRNVLPHARALVRFIVRVLGISYRAALILDMTRMTQSRSRTL